MAPGRNLTCVARVSADAATVAGGADPTTPATLREPPAPPLLAHKAEHEGVICVEAIKGLKPHPMEKRLIPGCTYCSPQVASVGLTEQAAKDNKLDVRVGRFPFVGNGKAIALGIAPDDPSYVLSQYSIERSIADGSSVPVHVETRLVDFHIDKEALDEAFEAMAEEEQLDEEERELLAEKASSAKTFMRNPDRVRAVCTDIVITK